MALKTLNISDNELHSSLAKPCKLHFYNNDSVMPEMSYNRVAYWKLRNIKKRYETTHTTSCI